ncbi:MAG: hypothetical protein ACK5Z2_03825, partial [Bacteroidota bacterium]
KIAFEVTMIAACLMPFGKGLKWLGGELYVAVTGGVETAAVGLGVYYFTHDFIVQYRALEMLPKDQRNKAMLELLAMSLMMGFLTYKAVRGVSESLGYKESYQPKPGDQNRPSDALVNPGAKKPADADAVTEPLNTGKPADADAVTENVTTGKPGEIKPVAKEESGLPPFTEEQLTYSQSGNIEYLNVKLETGEVFTLKREDGGEWFVDSNSGGKTTNAEVLGRVPEEFKKGKISDDKLITNKFPDDEIPTYGSSFEFEIVNGLFKTKNGGTLDGTWDFIITSQNELKLGSSHLFLANKKPVKAAGRIVVVEGKLTYIFNTSGHYRPSVQESLTFGGLFKNIGIETKGVELTVYEFISDNKGMIINEKIVVEIILE